MSMRNLRPLPSSLEPDHAAIGVDARSLNPDACSLCFGSGFEVVTGKGARRCSCRTTTASTSITDRTRLPELFARCSLANYRPTPGNTSQLRALTHAHDLVGEYPSWSHGLLFMGSVGTGKTHLAAGVSRALAEKGAACLFSNTGKLLKELQAAYDPSAVATERAVLTPILTTEVLVLDELGATKPTEWVRDTLLHVINTRYEERRMTLFTTNYSDEAGAAGEETLEDRIGVRLRSRLYQMCREVRIEGDDYRRATRSV